MKKRVFLLSAALLLAISPLQAQSSTSTSSASETDPVPYDLEAIPQGVLDLRRFEIIMFGAMPIVYLFSEIITSTALYAKYQSSEYIPLVGTAEITNNEKMYTVGVTFSLAFIVATVDMILYKKKQREQQSGEARRLRVRQAEELYGGIDSNFTPQPSDTLTAGGSGGLSETAPDGGDSAQTGGTADGTEESPPESGQAAP